MAGRSNPASTARSPSGTRSEDELNTIPSTASHRSDREPERHERNSPSIKVRFSVAISVLITMGIAVLLAQRLLASESSFVRAVGLLAALFLSFFGHEWCWVHANALTRQKRAHFDEANILETYQPRARTHGHLFHPDPPTPGPVVKFQEGDVPPERSNSERTAFGANRDAHYADMFNYAMRVAKEQEAMEKAAAAKSVASPTTKTAIPVKSPSTHSAKESSTRTAVTKDSSTRTADPKTEPTILVTEEPAKPADPTVAPTQPSVEEFTARDTNEKGEPLYENIDPMDIALPNAPRPSAMEKLQGVAQTVARTVSSKVRTALENTSLRGAIPSDTDNKSDKKDAN